MSLYKKVNHLYSESASYTTVNELVLYRNGFEKHDGVSSFAILGYVEVNEQSELDYSSVSLEPSEGRELVLLKYDFSREDEYKEAGGEPMKVPVKNLWMNVFDTEINIGISGQNDSSLPILPEWY